MWNLWTLCLLVSRASRLVSQETERAIMMKEPYFNGSRTASAFYDQVSSSWKTSQESLLLEEPALLERLPKSGMTQNGVLYELQTLEPATVENAGSVLLLTPQVTEDRYGRPEKFINRSHDQLTDQLAHLFPTPVVNDMGRGKTPEEWAAWVKKVGQHGDSLSVELQMLPTPQAWDANRGPDNSRLRGDGKRKSGAHGTLNLAGALALDVTNLALEDGKQSWEEQPLFPSTNEE